MSYELGHTNESPIRVTRNKDDVIPGGWLWPHYTDHVFHTARTVFLDTASETSATWYGADEVEGANYWYSDRIPADWDKLHRAGERAELELGTRATARYFELQLQEATDDYNLQLVHLMTGVNRVSGFPYHVYGVVLGGSLDVQS